MFPLSVLTYFKLAAGAVALITSFYFGWHLRDSDYQAYKAAIIIETATIEKNYQAKAAKIESEKNAQIRNINNQLVDAVSELRKRPSRAQSAVNGQTTSYCTGSQLYAEDAELALREAARADTIREALKACYLQYDSLQ